MRKELITNWSHIVLADSSMRLFLYMTWSWTNIRTVHNLILCDIRISTKPSAILYSSTHKTSPSSDSAAVPGIYPVSNKQEDKLKWEVKNLTNDSCKSAFQIGLLVNTTTFRKIKLSLTSVNEKWNFLALSIKSSAARTLKGKGPPLTPSRKIAIRNHHKAKFSYFENKTNRNSISQY